MVLKLVTHRETMFILGDTTAIDRVMMFDTMRCHFIHMLDVVMHMFYWMVVFVAMLAMSQIMVGGVGIALVIGHMFMMDIGKFIMMFLE